MAKNAKKAINKFSRQLEQKRMGGLNYSLDAMSSIYSNLLATQKGIARTMNTSNQRAVERLALMAQRNAAASAKAVSNTSTGMLSSYGGLYGGYVSQKMDLAQAESDAVATAGAAGVRTAKGLAKAGSMALAIEKAGVADAQAAARYALAQASIARAQADADAVAQMKLQLQLSQAGKTDAALNKISPGLVTVANLAGDISKEARRVVAELLADPSSLDGGKFSVAAAAQTVADNLNITEPTQRELVSMLVRSIYTRNLFYGQAEKQGGGATRDMEISAIAEAISMMYAGNLSDKQLALLKQKIGEYLTQIYNMVPRTDNTGDGQTITSYDRPIISSGVPAISSEQVNAMRDALLK